MKYPKKCHKCQEKYCEADCPAMKQMVKMDSSNIKRWAKEHNRLHKQIDGEFRIFSMKCKHSGMIRNSILPHPARCFHNNAANYTQGFTNCNRSNCPVLNLDT